MQTTILGTKFFIHKSCLPPRIHLNPDRLVKAIRAVVTCVLPNSPIIALSALSDIVATSKPEKRLLPVVSKLIMQILALSLHFFSNLQLAR